MELVLYDIEPFKAFFDLIYNSANEVEIKLSNDTLSMQLLNKSHVCFYGAEYRKDFFDTYNADENESLIVYVEDVYNILKSAHKNDVLTMESNENYLVCTFEHDFNRRVFELPLSDIEYSSPVPPSIPYDDGFFLQLNDLKQPINDLDKICKTDRFKMVTKDNELHILSPLDSQTRYDQTLMIDSDISVSVTINKDYVQEILKLSKINKEVEFKIGSDTPVTYTITSPMEDVKITGLIAPVIEQED